MKLKLAKIKLWAHRQFQAIVNRNEVHEALEIEELGGEILSVDCSCKKSFYRLSDCIHYHPERWLTDKANVFLGTRNV